MARVLCMTLNPALDMSVSVDCLTPGAVHRALDNVQTHAAGKGLNVAQVLSDLGHNLIVGGFLGQSNAAPFQALFTHRKFEDRFTPVEGATRVNIKIGESSGRHTDVNTPGFAVNDALISRMMNASLQLARTCDAVVVAGSLPPGFAPTQFRSWLEKLREQCPKLVLDTSGEALVQGVLAQPWLIKPNREELADLGQAPVQLHQNGIANVLVSDGAAGLTAYSALGNWHATPPTVTVKSTVGAGDTTVAGMLHGLLEGWPMQDALQFACACGTYAVTQVGFGLNDAASLDIIKSGVVAEAHTEQQDDVLRGQK